MGVASRCQWIYKEDDAAVLEGRAQIGDQCGSPRARPEQHNYCYGHYRSWCKANRPEVMIAEHEKKRDTMKGRNDSIIEDAAKDDNPYGIRADTIAALGLDEHFDLEKEYALYKRLNLDASQENYDEKFAYAGWLDTSPAMREPKEISEVSRILGVGVAQLERWRNTPEVMRILADRTKMAFKKAAKLVFYRLTDRALRGEAKAMELFTKINREIEEKEEAKPKAPPITQEQIDRASAICGDKLGSKFGGLEGPSRNAEKAVVFDAIANGDLKELDN